MDLCGCLCLVWNEVLKRIEVMKRNELVKTNEGRENGEM